MEKQHLFALRDGRRHWVDSTVPTDVLPLPELVDIGTIIGSEICNDTTPGTVGGRRSFDVKILKLQEQRRFVLIVRAVLRTESVHQVDILPYWHVIPEAPTPCFLERLAV